jgi:transcriptional regulator with XRE-family HTH domain
MLGAVLRSLRKNRGYTLAEVASTTGLSVSFLSDVERGRTRPSLDSLVKLADCYNSSITTIIDGVDAETLSTETTYPPGFKDFLREIDVEPDLVDLLLRMERRAAERALTKDDWLQYYYSLKAILNR